MSPSASTRSLPSARTPNFFAISTSPDFSLPISMCSPRRGGAGRPHGRGRPYTPSLLEGVRCPTTPGRGRGERGGGHLLRPEGLAAPRRVEGLRDSSLLLRRGLAELLHPVSVLVVPLVDVHLGDSGAALESGRHSGEVRPTILAGREGPQELFVEAEGIEELEEHCYGGRVVRGQGLLREDRRVLVWPGDDLDAELDHVLPRGGLGRRGLSADDVVQAGGHDG